MCNRGSGSRRWRRAAAALLLACAVLLACERAPHLEAPAPPERIVLVSIDTLRADHVGCYGADFAHTPVLDRLAREGIRFDQAIAPQPMTLPSHATLLTGLDPPYHGLRSNGPFRLREGLPVLTERLREAGYATAAFLSVVILDADLGFGRGFDVYDSDPQEGGQIAERHERRGDATVDTALAWLAGAPDRFFLWVHLYDPHDPYDAPGWLRRLRSASAYDAEVSFADAQVGRLRRAVDSRWRDGRSLYVVVADHGEALGEHGEPTHSYTIYDATQRVPLILSGSGLPRGRVVPSVVRLTDVAPTILALSELEPLPEISGRDLRPTWEGGDPEPRVAYVETVATQLQWGWSPLLGLRSDQYKYIRAPRPELYDVRIDPDEERNLAVERPGAVAALDAALSSLLADAPPPILKHEASLNVEALEALGYVVPARPRFAGVLGQVGGPDPKDHMHLLDAWHQVADLFRRGLHDEAWARLEELPKDVAFFEAMRAELALVTGRPARAEHHARQAIEGGLEFGKVLEVLGQALGELGRLDEAEAAFQRALELEPDLVEAMVGLGVVAEHRRRPAEAEEYYRRALEKRPTPRTAYLLAAVLIEEERDEEAEALLEQIDPAILRRPDAARRLALAEANSGRRSQGLARVERALREHPASPLLQRTRRELGGS